MDRYQYTFILIDTHACTYDIAIPILVSIIKCICTIDIELIEKYAYDLIDTIDRLLSIVFTREFTIIDNRAVISINLTD